MEMQLPETGNKEQPKRKFMETEKDNGKELGLKVKKKESEEPNKIIAKKNKPKNQENGLIGLIQRQ